MFPHAQTQQPTKLFSHPLTKNIMEVSHTRVVTAIAVAGFLLWWAWRILSWVWLKPKKLEICLRRQGYSGNPYRILFGDLKETSEMMKRARSAPMALMRHDIAPRVVPFVYQTMKNYGKNFFTWLGPVPRVFIMDHENAKDVFNQFNEFPKSYAIPLARLIVPGLASLEGEIWAKHRKIINPAFHVEKLKNMVAAFHQSCNEMISKWEKLVSLEGSCELDVWPHLVNLTCEIISRTAFGSNYEEGQKIFQLLEEQGNLVLQAAQLHFIPGYRFLPSKINRKMKKIDRDINASLMGIIRRREKTMKAGQTNDDLLGMLMESNFREIQENADDKNAGMSIQEVIEECKLFYFAGQETSSVLLVWTMILLAKHPDWQTRAREEVLQVFGHDKPEVNGLNHLKVVTMILYEVLRLYPPVVMLGRAVHKEEKLGNMIIPEGVEVVLPVLLIHHDHEIWGTDADEFKPERFSEGVAKATRNQLSFFPFGGGPRICIGQNFALMEAKMAVAMIIQNFWFELSPSYAHAPYTMMTMKPQHGAHLILQKLSK